jgi:radical SAM protein with 4Fe4S-binding SPASM domain
MSEIFDFRCSPSTSWLTVNRQCNLRCKWCYGEDSNFDMEKAMSLQMAMDLVEMAHSMGVRNFNIIGGEPTLWPGLFQLSDFCRELGVGTCLITNAARFADDRFWSEYQEHPCDSVSISVKSADRERFQDVTGSKCYDLVMKGIERGIHFHEAGVSTVYNSLVGMQGLKHIALTCREMGAKSITIDLCSPVVAGEGVSSGFSIEPHRLAEEIVEIQPLLSEMYKGNVSFMLYVPLCLFPAQFIEMMIEKGQIGTACHVYSRSGVNFDTNGDVLICNTLLDSTIAKAGTDYYDGFSLLEHLNSDELRQDYEQLLRYPSPECTVCRWASICRGGCLLNWMVFDPSICQAVKEVMPK